LRLLIDEQLSPTIAQQLRKGGFDVVHVREAGLAGKGDGEVMDWAAADQRSVVTNNIQDFRPLHASRLSGQQPHYGLVYVSSTKFSLRKQAVGTLIKALRQLLKANPAADALLDRELFL
jgi:predicted nuclease of predicted toxin-antitoxin system